MEYAEEPRELIRPPVRQPGTGCHGISGSCPGLPAVPVSTGKILDELVKIRQLLKGE